MTTGPPRLAHDLRDISARLAALSREVREKAEAAEQEHGDERPHPD